MIAGTDTNFPGTNQFGLTAENTPDLQETFDTRWMVVCYYDPVFSDGGVDHPMHNALPYMMSAPAPCVDDAACPSAPRASVSFRRAAASATCSLRRRRRRAQPPKNVTASLRLRGSNRASWKLGAAREKNETRLHTPPYESNEWMMRTRSVPAISTTTTT